MADHTAPDLTVVIPVWDHYTHLLPELVAALQAEVAGARIVVVDNASDVPLPPLSADVVTAPERVTSGGARNLALPLVETEFVCFFDADDLPIPGGLRTLMKVVRQRPEALVATGIPVAWRPGSDQVIPLPPTARLERASRHRLALGIASVARNRFTLVGSIIRTEAVRDAGGFSDLNYCEDWALATALSFRGHVILVLTQVVRMRIHVGSVIHREGTPAGIIKMLLPLYKRWLSDPAIPFYVKPLFVITPLPRLWQAVNRLRSGRRSHDDLIARLGAYSLPAAPQPGEGANGGS